MILFVVAVLAYIVLLVLVKHDWPWRYFFIAVAYSLFCGGLGWFVQQ